MSQHLSQHLDDPFDIAPQQQTAPQTVQLGPEHLTQIEQRLLDAAKGLTLTTTVDAPNGVTVTRSERAPDVKAALALATMLSPERWRQQQAGGDRVTVIVSTASGPELRARLQGKVFEHEKLDPPLPELSQD